MAYEMVMPYHLHMPSYFLETFTEYPFLLYFLRYVKVTHSLSGFIHSQRLLFSSQSLPALLHTPLLKRDKKIIVHHHFYLHAQ